MPSSEHDARVPRWNHEAVEETLDGARALTVSVVDRTIEGWWDELARECRIPARRWSRWRPHGEGPVVAMVAGRPAFDESAWARFASLVPGAVALRTRTAEAFGVPVAELVPPGRRPVRLLDLIGARRRRAHLRRAERRLEGDLAVLRARLAAHLAGVLADGEDGTPFEQLPTYALAARLELLLHTDGHWAPAGVVDVASGESTARLVQLLIAHGRSPGGALLEAARLSAGGGRAEDPTIDALLDGGDADALQAGLAGWRALRDLHLEAPPLRRDPEALERALPSLVAARDRTAEAPASLEQLPDDVRDEALRARRLTALRERIARDRADLHAGLRAITWSLAQQLRDSGALEAADDAFDLHVDALLALARGAMPSAQVVARSGATSTGADANTEATATADPAPASLPLRGIPASAGVATGPVLVLDSPALDAPVDGAVLVCRVTDPGWTPLLARCAALVTERGGPLAHAAIVARELGIPAVVGVTGARATLEAHAGDVVVDGAAGTVSSAS